MPPCAGRRCCCSGEVGVRVRTQSSARPKPTLCGLWLLSGWTSTPPMEGDWLRQDPKGPAVRCIPCPPLHCSLGRPFLLQEYYKSALPRQLPSCGKTAALGGRSPGVAPSLHLLPRATYWHMQGGVRIYKSDHAVTLMALWREQGEWKDKCALWLVVYNLRAFRRTGCTSTLTLHDFDLLPQRHPKAFCGRVGQKLPGVFIARYIWYTVFWPSLIFLKQKRMCNQYGQKVPEFSPTCFRTQHARVSQGVELPRSPLLTLPGTERQWDWTDKWKQLHQRNYIMRIKQLFSERSD